MWLILCYTNCFVNMFYLIRKIYPSYTYKTIYFYKVIYMQKWGQGKRCTAHFYISRFSSHTPKLHKSILSLFLHFANQIYSPVHVFGERSQVVSSLFPIHVHWITVTLYIKMDHKHVSSKCKAEVIIFCTVKND